MKKEIHPQYNLKTKVTCACGNSFEIGSTSNDIHTDVCSKCHPFYTGKQKLVDTARRVEKFESKVSRKDEASKTRKGQRVKKAALKEKRDTKIAIRKKPAVKKLGAKSKAKVTKSKNKPEAPKKIEEKTQEKKDSK